MTEHFKKGQMVPRRMVVTHKKTRVNVRFGCDVIIDGNIIYPTSHTDTGVICADIWKGRRRNNGTVQRVGYKFLDINIDCSKCPSVAAVRGYL